MSLDDKWDTGPSRRDFLKVVGGSAGALLAAGTAYANHPKPSIQSLRYLDQRTYLHNMEIIAHLPASGTVAEPVMPGRSAGQMMAIGKQRFLLSGRDVLDVTDPRNPQVFNDGGAPGSGELAYNQQLKKWILVTFHGVGSYYNRPYGKYEIPNVVADFRADKRFRGIRIWDATNPAKIVQLGEYNTGMTGAGGHSDQSYYDGGKYVYMGCAPDDSFVNNPQCYQILAWIQLILDVSDPANVKEVSRWWIPGQRSGEIEELKKWPCMFGRLDSLPNRKMDLEETIEALKKLKGPWGFPDYDLFPYAAIHGPMYVPKRVENGGTRGYSSWASAGMLIHDLSDITKPKLVGRFDPSPVIRGGWGGIAVHTAWLGTLPRGFIVTNGEVSNPDCNAEWLPNFVVDVRDETRPTPIATLGRPKAPPDAPFTDFCFRRGRFGAHDTPHLKAPGRMSQTFIPYEYFNAGVRCYDLSNPIAPQEVAYFVPPMGGHLSPECTVPAIDMAKGPQQQACIDEAFSFARPCNSVSIEWDRNIIYAGTTTGLYVLSTPALGKPIFDAMPVREWSLPDVNLGAP